MRNSFLAQEAESRTAQIKISYQTTLARQWQRYGLARIAWVTWLLTIVTIGIWCISAYQAALLAGAHSLQAVLAHITNNAIDIQPTDETAVGNVLVAFGAKDNSLILHGQYWRFVTPIFLHLNALHVGLNMFNLLFLGIYLERLFGHTRFLLIYLVTGVVSSIASFYFAPQEISVGASGAIFGLVGAYSIFMLVHRRALRRGGLIDLLWLVVVIGVNLSIGFFIPNVDNYAHIGGLISGCLLGWWFTPLYRQTAAGTLVDTHSLARRWPLALLTILGTLLLASIACYLNTAKS